MIKTFIHSIRTILLKLFVPIVQRVEYRRSRPTRTLPKSICDFLIVRQGLNVGDVLLSRTEGRFSNMFIPGFWKHAAIYIGDGLLIESTGSKGVVQTDLLSFLNRVDRCEIFKPTFKKKDHLSFTGDVVRWARSILGSPYDHYFEPNVKTFYCSEVIWFVYREIGYGEIFGRREIFGVETVLPQDFADAKSKWQSIGII